MQSRPINTRQCGHMTRERHRPLPFAVEGYTCGETKVPNFYLHVVVEEEIPELQVSVDNVVLVQVVARQHHLADKVATLGLCDGSSPFV